jgi:hypothetical protein
MQKYGRRNSGVAALSEGLPGAGLFSAPENDFPIGPLSVAVPLPLESLAHPAVNGYSSPVVSGSNSTLNKLKATIGMTNTQPIAPTKNATLKICTMISIADASKLHTFCSCQWIPGTPALYKECMNMVDHFARLFTYDDWANREVWPTCARPPPLRRSL